MDNPDIYSPREGVFYLISGRYSIGDERAKILSTKDGGSSFTEMSGLKNVAFYDWSFVGDTGYLVGPNGLLRKYEGRR